MIPFLSTFYLPENENLKIITIKHLVQRIMCHHKIPFLKDVQLHYEKGKRHVFFLKDENEEVCFSETPNDFRIAITKESENSVQIWFEWLNSLKKVLTYQMRDHKLHRVIERFISNEKKLLHQSRHSLHTLCKKRFSQKEMFLGWYPYKTYFTFPKHYETILDGMIHGFKIIFDQLRKKEQHEYVGEKVYEIFSYYQPQLEKILIEKNNERFEKIVVDFKKEIHILLDSKYSFVTTKNIHFRNWLKCIFMFDLYSEPCDLNIKKSVQKLHVILNLVFDIEQTDCDFVLQMNENCKNNNVNNLQVEKEMFYKIHPLMRGAYHDSILL